MQPNLDRSSPTHRSNRHSAAFALLPALLLLLLAPRPVLASAADGSPARSQPGITQANAWQKADANGRSLIATARALEPFLVRQADGRLRLAAPHDLTRMLPPRQVAMLVAGLATLNSKVATGNLQTTEMAAVFDPADDPLLVRGGWTGHGVAWWGQYWCFSHEALASLATYPNGVIAGLTLVVIAAIPGIGAAVDAFIAIYLGWLIYDDYGRGSCLNESWAVPPGWVTSQ